MRGLIPWPATTVEIKEETFKIFAVEETHQTSDKAPGTWLGADKRDQRGLRRRSGTADSGGSRPRAKSGCGLWTISGVTPCLTDLNYNEKERSVPCVPLPCPAPVRRLTQP